MIIKTVVDGIEASFDTQKGIELTLPVMQGPDTVNAFHIPDAVVTPLIAGGFVGSTAMGGACNCENITFNAHGNGTHTECVGHISKERIALHECLKEFMFGAELVSITPDRLPDGDFVITPQLLAATVKHNSQALIIRTLPNGDNKKVKRYSGTNPTYFTKEAADWIRERGIEHLLVDMPSVDREEDGGTLAAHHAFWNYPQATRIHSTITELIYVPDNVVDGQYLLSIAAGAFDSDASPSRIVIYQAM